MNRWKEEIKEEWEKIRKDLSDGRKEREELKEQVKVIERKIVDLESSDIREGGRGVLEVEGEKGEMGRKIKEIERKLERKEREERKRNLIIRELEVKESKRKEAVVELMKVIGVETEMKEIWRVAAEKGKEREMVEIKIENPEKRKEILEKKKNLRGRRERIMEDWTWRERRIRWRLEELARKEERKGRNIRIGYGKIKIEENWWR